MPKVRIKKILRNKILYSEYLEAKEGSRGSIETFMRKWEKELTRSQIYNIIKGMEG